MRDSFTTCTPQPKPKPNSLKIFRFVFFCDFSLFFSSNFSSERRWRRCHTFSRAPDASKLWIFVWLLLLRKKIVFFRCRRLVFLMNRVFFAKFFNSQALPVKKNRFLCRFFPFSLLDVHRETEPAEHIFSRSWWELDQLKAEVNARHTSDSENERRTN